MNPAHAQMMCRCGCGLPAPIATMTSKLKGWVKGRPKRFIAGHHARFASMTHGLSGTREHHIWRKMWHRCTNANNDRYHNYGGRGIRVCGRWRSFMAFLEDVGPAPSVRHTLDRINTNGHYQPSNVRWASSVQQARNSRRNHPVTVDGQTRCISEWAEISGTDKRTLLARLRRGWAAREAVFGHAQ